MRFSVPTAAAILFTTLAAAAQPAQDPDWPCVQRKVETLSLGLMWPHEVDPAEPTPDERDLIDTLALRRIFLEDARARVAAFMETHPGTTEADLGRIFQGVFARVDRERSRIISGIERYAEGQQELSRKIDATRAAFRETERSDPENFDRLDALEAEMMWDERIFQERQQSLTYVCESPVLLEQRLYAIAQLLLQAAP